MATYGSDSALVVVDVQNDFADPAGSLYIRGGEEVVPLIDREIALARAAGAMVVYTQDWHPPDTPHFAKDGGTWPVHCVRETWGAAFHPGLTVGGPVVRKGAGGEDGYSGFTVADPRTGGRSPTGLQDTLRAARVKRLVVVGLATDYCVKATALDGASRGFETTVLRAAVRAVNLQPGDEEAAFGEMAAAGVKVR